MIQIDDVVVSLDVFREKQLLVVAVDFGVRTALAAADGIARVKSLCHCFSPPVY